MYAYLLSWLKPTPIVQETEKTVLLKHALENNQEDPEIGDIILFDKGLAGYGVYGQRQLAYVHDGTEDDTQVIYIIKTKDMIQPVRKTRWIPSYSITSNMGSDHLSQQELIEMGIIDAKPQRAPQPLVSGTYVQEIGGDEYYLVEIEKVNGQYYIHDVNDQNCDPINENHDYTLLEFSQPEEGNYILDPGLYINSKKVLHEVVPFKGSCWVRELNEAEIFELTEDEALELTRVETDEVPNFYLVDPLTDQLEDTETNEFDEHLEPYKVKDNINTENQPGCQLGPETEKCCGKPNNCAPFEINPGDYDAAEIDPPERT